MPIHNEFLDQGDFDGTTRIDWRDPRILAELFGDVDAEIRAIERDVRRHLADGCDDDDDDEGNET